MLASDALAAFRQRHYGGTTATDAKILRVKIGVVTLWLPNPGHLVAHDLHHVLLEAAPDLRGEAQVGVFELRTGTPTVYIWLLCAAAVLLGLFLCPREVRRWWRGYRGKHTLYRHPHLDALLESDLERARDLAGLSAGRAAIDHSRGD